MSEGTLDFPSRAVAPDVAVGRYKIWVSSVDDKPYITTPGGTAGFETVYGSNFIGDSSVGEDTNTLSTYKTYLGFAYPPGLNVTGQKYEIQMTALTRMSVNSRNHICRIAIDSSTLGDEIQVEHKDSGADMRVPVGYNYLIDGSQLNGAGGFIDFDFRSQQNGDTAYIYSCTLTFKRVL